MGEALWVVRGAWPSYWDIRDCAVGRDREVCFNQGVCHIHQCFQNAQKNLGELTHPIIRTSLMQMIVPSSPGADGMRYANAPTCSGLTVPQWYASVTSGYETRTGPCTGSASHTDCRMRGKA